MLFKGDHRIFNRIEIILCKTLFIFSLFGTTFISWADPDARTKIQQEIERVSGYMTEENVNNVSNTNHNINHGAEIQSAKRDLHRCRERRCGRNCRQTKGEEVCEREKPIPTEECDRSYCSTEKKQLENLIQAKKEIDASNEALKEGENEHAGNSSIAQVRKKKKNMGFYKMLGVGTTAFLGYKTKTACACCKGCTGSCGCCTMCPIYGVMTGLAGYQTLKMFDKEDDLQKTEDDMCIAKGMCQTGAGAGAEEEEEEFCPKPVPKHICGQTQQKFKLLNNVTNDDCSPNDPDCDPTNTNPAKLPPGLGDDGTNITGITNNDISEMLGDTFKPEGGWPGEVNPFSDSGKFNYDQLPKNQKKKIDDMLSGLNKQKQDFMSQNGLGGLDSDSDLDNQGLLGASGTSSGSGKGVSAAFKGGEDDGSRSLSALTGNSGSRPRKSSSLAEQMQNMLKAMHGGKNKNEFGFLGDTSVKIGRDNVGVREDNIFHMVHRMNRKLDGEKRFIPTISF